MTIFQARRLIVRRRDIVSTVADIDTRVTQRVRSGVVSRYRTLVSLGFLLSVVLGGALLAFAVQEWTIAWRPLRGLALGFFTGAFGAAAFWTGVLSARRSGRDERAPSTGRETEGESAGGTMRPEEAKRWLQKFLEEQQNRDAGPKA